MNQVALAIICDKSETNLVRDAALMSLVNDFGSLTNRLAELLPTEGPEFAETIIFAIRDIYLLLPCDVVEQLCESDNPGVRGAAVEVLGDLRHSMAPYLARKLLRDADPLVRFCAAATVGALGMQRLRKDLKGLALTDFEVGLFGETVSQAASKALDVLAHGR